jgi:hypothetical protein
MRAEGCCSKMSHCSECCTENKLFYCCKRNPLTRKSHAVKIEGKWYEACTSLDEDGRCVRYDAKNPERDTRPWICKTYECPKIIFDVNDQELSVLEEKVGIKRKSEPQRFH